MSAAAEEPRPVNPILPYLEDILANTDETNPRPIAEIILERMPVEEQLEAFAFILPAWVSSKLSYDAPPSVPSLHSVKNDTSAPKIKKAGMPKFLPGGKAATWDKKRLSSGENGVWVFWPEFTRTMALTKVDSLQKRVDTTVQSIKKYQSIADFLEIKGAEAISDLTAEDKSALEQKLGALPEDAV